MRKLINILLVLTLFGLSISVVGEAFATPGNAGNATKAEPSKLTPLEVKFQLPGATLDYALKYYSASIRDWGQNESDQNVDEYIAALVTAKRIQPLSAEDTILVKTQAWRKVWQFQRANPQAFSGASSMDHAKVRPTEPDPGSILLPEGVARYVSQWDTWTQKEWASFPDIGDYPLSPTNEKNKVYFNTLMASAGEGS